MLCSALALGACAMPDFDSFRTPDAASMFRPLSVTGLKESASRPVTAEDLVDGEGRCAAATANAATGGDPAGAQPGVPLVPAAITLEMTECDVVKRAGTADRVEVGASENRERTANLTFNAGSWPGIYHFVGGRLKSMERAPEVAAPVKPAKPKPKTKRTAVQAAR